MAFQLCSAHLHLCLCPHNLSAQAGSSVCAVWRVSMWLQEGGAGDEIDLDKEAEAEAARKKTKRQRFERYEDDFIDDSEIVKVKHGPKMKLKNTGFFIAQVKSLALEGRWMGHKGIQGRLHCWLGLAVCHLWRHEDAGPNCRLLAVTTWGAATYGQA